MGGTPTLAGDTKFLGFQEMPDVNPAIATLKQVERMRAMAAVAICRKTDALRWALPARKLCLEKVHTVIQHLLPLALTAPMAAARLTSMQGRWAHIILMGRAYYADGKLTRQQLRMLKADLGWTSLWMTTVQHSVMM